MASPSRGRNRSESGPDVHSDTSTLSPTVHEPQSARDNTMPQNTELNSNQDAETRDISYENSDDERNGAAVAKLARQLTQHSIASTSLPNPFAAEAGSVLDPHSPSFNPRAWCKSMLRMYSGDEKSPPPRTSGFSFRNLNVHGFGTTTDFQKNMANVVLEGVGAVRKVMGIRKEHKIDILQNMDGLVNSGELLVVLGPPGSGCSTFLKTVAGETHGLVVDVDSELNYQGELFIIDAFLYAALNY